MTKSRAINDMHGCRHTRAYAVWMGMKARCCNPNNPAYHNYGGRGICVAQEWSKFSGFIGDMGHPADGMTLERVDNDLGYSKNNCVWATRTEQGRNKRNNVLITIGEETHPLSVWAERNGIAYQTAHMRLRKGWAPKDAVTLPLVTKRKGVKRGVALHKVGTERDVKFREFAGEMA